jgi:AcrR family transcriptional regulator
MTIPEAESWAAVDPETAWTALSAEVKRERILCAAGRVFNSEGLDAPMPAVAAAAGAGVASVYRQFPSKRDLLAALVTRRLEQIRAAAREATDAPGDRWSALTEMLRAVVEGQAVDDFLGDAYRQVSEQPAVLEAAAETVSELERLLAAARAEGRLRPDATAADVWLVFAATRTARELEPHAFRRMLQLLIDGLETRPDSR